MCKYWTMARTQINNPNAIIRNQSQEFSELALNSVERLTITVHLVKDNPNPARAPYLKWYQILVLKNWISNFEPFIPCGNCVAKAHEQEKSDPVKKERSDEGCEKHKIVSKKLVALRMQIRIRMKSGSVSGGPRKRQHSDSGKIWLLVCRSRVEGVFS